MTKAFTVDDFCLQVANDRTWRVREISDLKVAAKSADKGLQQVLLRALVALCYAHWEGSVRFAARKYLEHVALRKLPYSSLNAQFYKNYFLPRLTALSSSKVSVAERCRLLQDILTASEHRFGRVNDDLVNTNANLNSATIADICLICSLPTDLFAESVAFIDVMLLKRRNSIAHGEDTFVAADDLDELSSGTIALMRTFGDALENLVVLGKYRST